MSNFALYKLPDSTEATRVESFSSPEVIASLNDIDCQKGFLIAPFDVRRKQILLIKGDMIDQVETD